MRRTTATIDLSAIVHNYQYVKSLYPNTTAIAVIKADAYGHGAINVSQCLSESADMFGVARIDEALLLRKNGIKNSILLLEGMHDSSELDSVLTHNLTLVVVNFKQIEWLNSVQKSLQIFIKFDSGMHRLGFVPSEIERAINSLKKKHQLTLMSHFANADEVNHPFITRQIEKTNLLIKKHKLPFSFSNSAAILRQITSEKDFIRPGIMLYGVSPFGDINSNLKPAMCLTAPIINLKRIRKGDAIGYGLTHTFMRNSLVATVAIGYGDGFPRHIQANTYVVVNAQKSNIVGQISMDMLCIDVTNIDSVKLGDMVELFGEQISANTLAESAGTIAYELFCQITQRVHRVYLR